MQAVALLMGLIAAGPGVLAQHSYAQPPAEKPAPRRDGYGDPLPGGAIARIGSERLRHTPMPFFVAFTPDAKNLISQSQGSVRV
jgi:hypothetical protein